MQMCKFYEKQSNHIVQVVWCTWCSVFQHHIDSAIGVYIIDRYTYYALDFLERVEPDSSKTMGEFVSIFIKVIYCSIKEIEMGRACSQNGGVLSKF